MAAMINHHEDWLQWRRFVQLVCCVVTWWTAAVVVTVSMRELISGNAPPITDDGFSEREYYDFNDPSPPAFPYPFALTAATNVAAMVYAGVFHGVHRCVVCLDTQPQVDLSWRDSLSLMAVGTIQGFEIGFQNAALAFLPVSARTVAGSAGLVFMMCSACFWGLESVDSLRVIATILICTGGILNGLGVKIQSEGVVETQTKQFWGLVLVFVAQFLSAQRWSLIQVLLQRSSVHSGLKRLSKLQMLPRIMPANTAVCLMLSLLLEAPSFQYVTLRAVGTFLMVSVGITMIVSSELAVVHLTSALAMNVLSSLHGIPMVLGGIILLHENLEAVSVGGFLLCLCGAFVYFYARARRAAQVDVLTPPLLDVSGKPGKPELVFESSPKTPFIYDVSPKVFFSPR